jgi:hypothetical protein
LVGFFILIQARTKMKRSEKAILKKGQKSFINTHYGPARHAIRVPPSAPPPSIRLREDVILALSKNDAFVLTQSFIN